MKLKNLALAVLCAVVMPGTAFSWGKVETDSLTSGVLSAQVRFNVYLPDGYDASNHYPVIYLLHGLSDTYTSWMEKGNMSAVADELMESGECRKAVASPSLETWAS